MCIVFEADTVVRLGWLCIYAVTRSTLEFDSRGCHPAGENPIGRIGRRRESSSSVTCPIVFALARSIHVEIFSRTDIRIVLLLSHSVL